MKEIQTRLMAYGVDSAAAEKIADKYDLAQLKGSDLNTLISLGLSERSARRILDPARTPIPSKTVDEVLIRSAFACCVCRQSGLPIAIHHIDKWAHSHSHDIDNLAVLCLNHHGEAHSQHEMSRNLTPERIRKARDQWYQLVGQRAAERETAVKNLKKYQGRWDYFNISYIYGLMADRGITFSSRYWRTLVNKGLIGEDGMIDSEKLPHDAPYWLNFFDGQYLKLYIEEMVNAIVDSFVPLYIKDTSSLHVQESIRPGDLLLVDGRFYFKRMNKRMKGIGQTRRAQCTICRRKFTGEFDAWFCNSSSSHGVHLTGNKHATQLCLVRSVEKDGDLEVVDCTIIGLGLGLTEPDLMAELMGGPRTLPAARPATASDDELDRISDLQRVQREKLYFSPPPEVCDICGVSLQDQKYMVDGAVKGSGVGACMCSNCFHMYGAGIGWGVGQLYLHEDDQWLMVGGFRDDTDDEL